MAQDEDDRDVVDVQELTPVEKIACYHRVMTTLSGCGLSAEDALCLLSKVMATVIVSAWKPTVHRQLAARLLQVLKNDIRELAAIVAQGPAVRAADWRAGKRAAEQWVSGDEPAGGDDGTGDRRAAARSRRLGGAGRPH